MQPKEDYSLKSEIGDSVRRALWRSTPDPAPVDYGRAGMARGPDLSSKHETLHASRNTRDWRHLQIITHHTQMFKFKFKKLLQTGCQQSPVPAARYDVCTLLSFTIKQHTF